MVSPAGKLSTSGPICKSPVKSGKSGKAKFKDAIRLYKMNVMLNNTEVSVEVK